MKVLNKRINDLVIYQNKFTNEFHIAKILWKINNKVCIENKYPRQSTQNTFIVNDNMLYLYAVNIKNKYYNTNLTIIGQNEIYNLTKEQIKDIVNKKY